MIVITDLDALFFGAFFEMGLLEKYEVQYVESPGEKDHWVVQGPGIGPPWMSDYFSDDKKTVELMAECMNFGRLNTTKPQSPEPDYKAMWEKLKESLLERAKGCGISSPVDLKRIQHFVNVTLAEMTALETAGPTERTES